MKRDQHIAARLHAVGRRSFSVADRAAEVDQRVDHRVAHVVDRLGRPAFGQQVLTRLGRVDEEQIRDLVGQHAVQLL